MLDYIQIEGCDGTGKSTLAKKFAELNSEYEYRNEPSSQTQLLKDIRNCAIGRYQDDYMTPIARELLMMASRSIAIAEIQQNILSKGKKVICDRGFLSGMVYANIELGITFDGWMNLFKSLHIGILPDLVVVVNSHSLNINTDEGNIYDDRESEFYEKVQITFSKASKWVKDNTSIKIINFLNDFDVSPEDNATRLRNIVRFL